MSHIVTTQALPSDTSLIQRYCALSSIESEPQDPYPNNMFQEDGTIRLDGVIYLDSPIYLDEEIVG